jgi:hypothetical protein
MANNGIVIALPKLSQVRGEVRREKNGTERYAALTLLAEMLKNRKAGYPVRRQDLARQLKIVAGFSPAVQGE